jgi:hypothetical protein
MEYILLLTNIRISSVPTQVMCIGNIETIEQWIERYNGIKISMGEQVSVNVTSKLIDIILDNTFDEDSKLVLSKFPEDGNIFKCVSDFVYSVKIGRLQK